jgi:phytoene dehydrogenase-like protein
MPAAFDRLSFGEAARLALALPGMGLVFTKWMKVPLQRLVDGLQSERLRQAFSVLFGDALRDFPAGAFFMMLGFMAKKSAGYPIGGSRAFAHAIEDKYLSLGGKIRYGAKVDGIIVEGARGVRKAVGLRGSWGEERCDYVVSAADGRDTLDRLLSGAYKGCAMDGAFATQVRYPSLLFAGFGLDHDCSALPHARVFMLDRPLVLESGALKVDRLMLRLFNFDPTLAPKGKTAATVMIETGNDGYWTSLAERDPEAYAAEKKAVADAIIAAIELKLPGFASWVETVDVATPKTFIRYTNNWHGSYEGWLPTSKTLGGKIPRTIEGLENFEMVGQWVNAGGGLPPCGIDGRNLAKRLCKKEGLRFRPE